MLFIFKPSVFAKKTPTPRFLFYLKFYLLLVVLALGLLGFVDCLWYSQYGDRINDAHTWDEFTSDQVINTIFCLAAFLSFFWTVNFVRTIKNMDDSLLQKTGIFGFGLTILFLAVGIRGSFGPHHLDLRDAKVTDSAFLNVACIPSPYALDQALRHRR